MPPTRDLLVVLVFSITVRALITGFITPEDQEVRYYVRLTGQLVMFATITLLCTWLIRRAGANVAHIFGRRPTLSAVLGATGLGVALFGFTLGENSLEVLVAAQVDVEVAYQFWNFRPLPYDDLPFFSLEAIAALSIGCLIAPYVEELLFRGLLVPSIAVKSGFRLAVLFGSALFTLLHYRSPYYLSILVFAAILSYVYLWSQSLILCVIIHATFNLLDFAFKNYLDFHLVRTPDRISNILDWLPEMCMLFLSLLMIYLICKKQRILFQAPEHVSPDAATNPA